jgi:hypothetical protein
MTELAYNAMRNELDRRRKIFARLTSNMRAASERKRAERRLALRHSRTAKSEPRNARMDVIA